MQVLRVVVSVEILHVCRFSHSIQENVALERQSLNSFSDIYRQSFIIPLTTDLFQPTTFVQQITTSKNSYAGGR